MSKTVKIVLIVLGVLLLLSTTCVGGGLWWLSTKAESMKAQGDEMRREAEAFAETTDAAGCLDEATRRNLGDGNILDEVRTHVFLAACLRGARPTEGLCEGVPSMNQILTTVKWRLARCQQGSDPDPERCSRLLAKLQEHCHPR
ncbi:MAG: hypothetical protein P1V51_17720 [Deltaproteobacteria bacterium]|nr:hypothetical protein [Deltaproteobacteria bacterium]